MAALLTLVSMPAKPRFAAIIPTAPFLRPGQASAGAPQSGCSLLSPMATTPFRHLRIRVAHHQLYRERQPITGKPPIVSTTADRFAEFVAEAAQRFGIPATWIRAVMRAFRGGARDLA